MTGIFCMRKKTPFSEGYGTKCYFYHLPHDFKYIVKKKSRGRKKDHLNCSLINSLCHQFVLCWKSEAVGRGVSAFLIQRHCMREEWNECCWFCLSEGGQSLVVYFSSFHSIVFKWIQWAGIKWIFVLEKKRKEGHHLNFPYKQKKNNNNNQIRFYMEPQQKC